MCVCNGEHTQGAFTAMCRCRSGPDPYYSSMAAHHVQRPCMHLITYILVENELVIIVTARLVRCSALCRCTVNLQRSYYNINLQRSLKYKVE
jgi:hypothetical protein